ncbi:MAG TPA: hypothetical protein VMH50_02025 [Thermoleophilia bacterium]|nr:hypothetical protein [Thermoleophilia bacterium]
MQRDGEIALGPFTAADVERLAELDRSESVPMVYVVSGGEIVPLGRGEEIPQWSGRWLAEVVDLATRRAQSAKGLPPQRRVRARRL